VLEGTLRESVRGTGGFDSLAVLSMLHAEFEARRAASLELVR
jgi:hypothetical protein